MGAILGMVLVVGEAEGMLVGWDEGEAEGVEEGDTVGCCVSVGGMEGMAVGLMLVEGEEVGE